MPLATAERSTSPSQRVNSVRPVVFVESYPQVIAGQQQTLMAMLEEWKSHQIPAIIFVPQDGFFANLLKERGVVVRLIQQPPSLNRYGGVIYNDRLWSKARTWYQAASYVLKLRRELKALDARAVFCNDMRGILTAGIAARSLRLPVMTWDKLDKPHGRLDWFELPLLQRTAVISNAVLKKFPRWQVRWYQNRIKIVADGAELERFNTAASCRSTLGLGEDDIVLGIVGTVCERKGHDRIFALLPQLIDQIPQVTVLVVGSWSDERSHEEYYRSLPYRDHSRVRFLGALPASEMPGIMQSLDLLVIPSRHEGMGLVVAEAMACGIPVAGANVGGIPEIVADGETGLIFDGDDPEDVLRTLLTLGQDLDLRRRMGQAGRERAERHFNRQVQMRRICELFREIIPPTP